jgi:phosphate transport system substrate-binding protein
MVAGFTGSANADPVNTYVTVGSDTIQDISNALAANVGQGTIGSWDAVNPGDPTNPHDTINPKPGCSMTRPNGSGEGFAALRKSINPSTTATQLANPPEPGCVDFSRSSSAPTSFGAIDANGLIQFIPIALDAVTAATGPATAVTGTSDDAVATAITHADDLTVANLTTLYSCNPVSVDGVSYVPDGTVTNATTQPIHLYIPQTGSGTRNFWASTLGFNATTPPSCVHDHSVLDPTEQVQEHDGTIFAQDADALGPFSIAQFISQSNGHNDRRHHVAIHSLNATPPTVAGGLNSNFPVTREVYYAVKRSRITSGSSDFDPVLTGLLVSADATHPSVLCNNSLAFISFGFGKLKNHFCGQAAADLRIFPNANQI